MAKNRIEHPSGNSDLVSVGKLDYKTLLPKAPQSAQHFDFCSTKGVILVMDLLNDGL
jgi:hypothetical protein